MPTSTKDDQNLSAKERLENRLRAAHVPPTTTSTAPAATPTLEDQVVQRIAKDLADDYHL